MLVALVQCDICWEERESTLSRIESWVERAAAAGAELILLPEMFAVGFSMATDRVAEAEDGPTSRWLQAFAHDRNVSIGGSIPTRISTGRVRNRFVLATPRGVLTYDKVKPFAFAHEDDWYEPGPGTTTWEVSGVRMTPFVCYDLRFADLWWQRAPDTDVYLCVASWPASRRRHWLHLLVARAIENQAWVIACNRVGEGGGQSYCGDSMVVDPNGVVVAAAAEDEGIVLAQVDPARTQAVRAQLPFLADR